MRPALLLLTPTSYSIAAVVFGVLLLALALRLELLIVLVARVARLISRYTAFCRERVTTQVRVEADALVHEAMGPATGTVYEALRVPFSVPNQQPPPAATTTPATTLLAFLAACFFARQGGVGQQR